MFEGYKSPCKGETEWDLVITRLIRTLPYHIFMFNEYLWKSNCLNNQTRRDFDEMLRTPIVLVPLFTIFAIDLDINCQFGYWNIMSVWYVQYHTCEYILIKKQRVDYFLSSEEFETHNTRIISLIPGNSMTRANTQALSMLKKCNLIVSLLPVTFSFVTFTNLISIKENKRRI